MLKKVIMPEAVEGLISPHDLIRTAVLPYEFWRISAERVEQALDIFTAIDGNPPEVILTAELREVLLAGMVLEGKTLNPPTILRQYLKLQRAIQVADDFSAK